MVYLLEARHWGSGVALKQRFGAVYREGQALLTLLHAPGLLPPDPDLPLSPFNTGPSREPARDAQGRVQLPADNVAALGRSLFTDYLVAFELAGFLLLVATIGAIAIAQRRSPSPTPGLPGSPGPIGTLGTGPSQERTT